MRPRLSSMECEVVGISLWIAFCVVIRTNFEGDAVTTGVGDSFLTIVKKKPDLTVHVP